MTLDEEYKKLCDTQSEYNGFFEAQTKPGLYNQLNYQMFFKDGEKCKTSIDYDVCAASDKPELEHPVFCNPNDPYTGGRATVHKYRNYPGLINYKCEDDDTLTFSVVNNIPNDIISEPYNYNWTINGGEPLSSSLSLSIDTVRIH